jgi:RecB family exonuclease
MPERLKISASQIQKVRRCKRAYAFEYVEGFRSPSSPKQQFGTDVHAHLENWIKSASLPDDTPAGQLAKMAISKEEIPAPDMRLLTEHNFVYRWSEDVDVGGFIDLMVPPELSKHGAPLIIDYKTTSDLRWAKTPEQLENDEQAILYAIEAMMKFNARIVDAKWIWLAATSPKNGYRKPAGVRPTYTMFDAHDHFFQAKVKKLDKDIQEISRIRNLNIRGLSLPPSPESCEMYGGCPHKEKCNLSGADVLGAHMEKETLKHNKKPD